jgi:hypothetical protein
MEATSKQNGGHGLFGPRAIWAAGDYGPRGPPTWASQSGRPDNQGRARASPIEVARKPGPGSDLCFREARPGPGHALLRPGPGGAPV